MFVSLLQDFAPALHDDYMYDQEWGYSFRFCLMSPVLVVSNWCLQDDAWAWDLMATGSITLVPGCSSTPMLAVPQEEHGFFQGRPDSHSAEEPPVLVECSFFQH